MKALNELITDAVQLAGADDLAAIFDGAMRNYRWCEKCCEAMAASWTDNGDAWTARVALARMGPNARLSGPQQREEDHE